MTDALLAGTRVLVLGSEPAVRAGRVLCDLGAEVIRVAPSPDLLARRQSSFLAWTAGMTALTPGGDGAITTAHALAPTADVIIDTPRDRDSLVLDEQCAPKTNWIHITPFGMDGPRSSWIGSDLGVMASSGNMYSTGYQDRSPLRAVEPTSSAHVAGEAALAAIGALFSKRRQIADVSMQECVFVASMAAAGRYLREGNRGRRGGANIGRTREIWPTIDGFVSFGIRGGTARQASMRMITELVDNAGIDASALRQDWTSWSQNTASDQELRAMEDAVGAYFATRSMEELYDTACRTNLMLAPANSPREIYASAQLAAREFFGRVGEVERFPRSFVVARGTTSPGPRRAAAILEQAAFVEPRVGQAPSLPQSSTPVFSGVRILEFGSGAAGPIATRYFAEHGATVIRIESRTRPDFLRSMAVGPTNPHGLEGSDMYDALNCGKRNLSLNLKHPEAVAIVRRLVSEWADAVAENYAPRAMKGFGLDYDTLTKLRPDLVMISACLNGQTGPHKEYPGFGGQGSALAGWNWVTGWPDREPVGPFGTITDSLAPRYVASALAAGLLRRATTGMGCYLDVSQVETGAWALAPWLIDYDREGIIGMRNGNRSATAVPHGAFLCADEHQGTQTISDRWVAIACADDEQWKSLAVLIGVNDRSLDTVAARAERVDEVEDLVGAFTRNRTRLEVATTLQNLGIEAVPVADFADVHDDPQVAHRMHFIEHDHPFMGRGLYERNGIRYSDAPSGYTRAGPTIGQDNEWVLQGLLGLGVNDIAGLRSSGALE